jgi:hypothetical protein
MDIILALFATTFFATLILSLLYVFGADDD